MKKTLLFVLALIMSVGAFAKKGYLPFDNLGAGWGSTYDAATKTITYTGTWSGRGWWFNEGSRDYSAYTHVVVEFEATDSSVKLVVQYADESNNDPEAYVEAGKTTIDVALDPTKKNAIRQVYLQKESGTLTLVDAYFTDGQEETASAVYDFDAETVGTTYGALHAWGWPAQGTSANITVDPLRAGNSLKMNVSNYDAAVYFTVNLPEGSTLADLTAIRFETHFGDKTDYAAVELFIAPISAPIGNGTKFNTYPVSLKSSDGTSGKPDPIQVCSGGEWYKITITREQIADETFNLGVDGIPTHDFEAVNALSQFLFGVGVSVAGGTEYYMDNIEFVLGDQSGIVAVKPIISPVYNTEGGIIVNAVNGKVSIYSIDGRLVKQTLAGNNTIYLNKGLYIVKVGTSATKVLVK